MDEQEKIKQIEEIHLEYKEKLDALRREQDKVLAEYLSKLEKTRMEELRNKLQA